MGCTPDSTRFRRSGCASCHVYMCRRWMVGSVSPRNFPERERYGTIKSETPTPTHLHINPPTCFDSPPSPSAGAALIIIIALRPPTTPTPPLRGIDAAAAPAPAVAVAAGTKPATWREEAVARSSMTTAESSSSGSCRGVALGMPCFAFRSTHRPGPVYNVLCGVCGVGWGTLYENDGIMGIPVRILLMHAGSSCWWQLRVMMTPPS